MGKLMDDLYDLMIDGREDTPQLVEPAEKMKIIDAKVDCLDGAMQDFIAEIQAAWQLHGFANGFACAMRLLGECGFSEDKLTEQAGKFFKSKQESPAEAAESAEDKQGQEDKPQTAPAAADGAQVINNAKAYKEKIDSCIDKINDIADYLEPLHFDCVASVHFDMLRDYIDGIHCPLKMLYGLCLKYIGGEDEQTETPCTCGGCNDCKCSDEAVGGVQA